MGILEITVNTEKKDEEEIDVNNHKEALKLITFMLYYAYYNTFEEPLNEHLYQRIRDVQSEKSSKSFAVTLGEMLKVMNKQSESIEEDSTLALSIEAIATHERNSHVISELSRMMAEELEGDLFEGLNRGEIKKASTQLQTIAKHASRTGKEAIAIVSKTALLETNKYYEEKSEFYRLLNREKYMYVILALKTISISVEGHNNNLLYKLTLQDQDYKKTDAVNQLLDELAEKDWERELTNLGWNKDEDSIFYNEVLRKRWQKRSEHIDAYKTRIKEELESLGITGEFTVEQLAEKQALKEKRVKAATNWLYNMADKDWEEKMKSKTMLGRQKYQLLIENKHEHNKKFIAMTKAEWTASGKTYESIGQELLMEGDVNDVAKTNTLEAVNLLWKKPEKLSENSSLMKAKAYLQKYKSNMELSKDYVKKSFNTLDELIAYKNNQPNYQKDASIMWREAMSNLEHAITNIKSYDTLKFLPELERNREVK